MCETVGRLCTLHSTILHRFVTDGDERSAGEAEAAAQEEAPAADPNLYQKCYDYYMNFYRNVTWFMQVVHFL